MAVPEGALGAEGEPAAVALGVDLHGYPPSWVLGVVHLITTEITSLYEQVGAGQFSTPVGVDYEPDANDPVNAQLLMPLYKHEKS